MKSIRPITLKRLVSLLRLLTLKSPQSIEELRYSLNFSETRLKELLHELRRLNLVGVSGNYVEITDLGKDFVKAYERGDGLFIHNVLMRLEAYRKVYSYYVTGVVKPQDIRAKTGLSIVTIDVVLRLIRELNSLSRGLKMQESTESSSINKVRSDIDFKLFTLKLIQYYEKLVKKLKSRYVPLSVIKGDLAVELGVGLPEIEKLLKRFIGMFTDYVSLSPPSPFMESKHKEAELLTFRGRKYAFIMIDTEGVLSCLK